MVVIRRAPDAPSGWPSAIAPPQGLSCSSAAPVSRCHISGTDAKASFTSQWSIRSSERPLFASTRRVAGTGAVSISSGSSPRTSKATKRARGTRPRSLAVFSLVISSTAAPSVIWEEFPAVTLQLISGKRAAVAGSTKDGLSMPRSAAFVAGRMVSSRSIGPRSPSTGTTSASNSPCCCA